ncbi:MAG TPA: glycosyltransferase family 4 protein [Acidimicrobiia bacterium]
MRVGVVCPYDISKPGGVQQLTGELATHLRDAGDEVVFVGAGRSWFQGGPGLDDVTVPTGRAIGIRANLSKAPLTLSPVPWRRVRRALADVDVVHVHEPLIPLIGWMALSTSRPLVATFHADAPDWVSRLYRVLPGIERRLRESIITAVSSTAARSIPSSWGTVRIVPNAIDVSAYDLPVGRVDRRVAFLGRDDARKGLSVLLEAWPHVVSRVPEAELIVMGADRDIDIQGVEFKGTVSGGEKRRLLASSLVFVAPNLGGESFGIVVAEGMAAGCAVVASDIPAFVEVTGGAAVHVPVGDVRTLAERLIYLLLDPAKARELGHSMRVRSAGYDWSAVVDEYRGLYFEAIS